MLKTIINQNNFHLLNAQTPHLAPDPSQPLINLIPARAFPKKAPAPQLKAMASHKIKELKI